LASQAIHFLGARFQFVLHGQRNFQCQRANGLDQQLADGTVERATHNALADGSCVFDAVTLAGVLG
jgi:hypothetical protein